MALCRILHDFRPEKYEMEVLRIYVGFAHRRRLDRIDESLCERLYELRRWGDGRKDVEYARAVLLNLRRVLQLAHSQYFRPTSRRLDILGEKGLKSGLQKRCGVDEYERCARRVRHSPDPIEY